MNSTFPLLQLPKKAIMTALKYCGVSELILLSTLSKRAKHLVKSDRRNALTIEVSICHGCIVELNNNYTTIMFGESQQKESDMESLTSCTVRVLENGPPTDISVPEFGGVRNWLEHFMFIFNHPKIGVCFGPRGRWKYSLESVKKVSKGLPIERLEVLENACEVIQNFPIMNSLLIDKTDLEPDFSEAGVNLIKKTLIGNIVRLDLIRAMPIDLGTLLMINSREIKIYRPSITEKELNTFLKLWQKGANPNLRRLYIDFVEHRRKGLFLNRSTIMKGIKGSKNVTKFSLRYEIRKKDGTLADVIISPASFDLFVQK